MAKTLYCAFNVTRQAFLSLGVAIADTPFARFRGLLGKARLRSGEAIWFLPSHGVHTIGLRSPADVLYLDSNCRIVLVIENLAPLHIPVVRWNCASILLLPVRSVFDSGTQIGDQLLINSVEELSGYWESQRQELSNDDLRTFGAAESAGSTVQVARGVVMAELPGLNRKAERRRADRLKPERLLAHYWTGGFSAPHLVREISLTGALVAAEEPHYPGTVLRLALEDAAFAAPDQAVRFAGVWATVLRAVEDGFCVGFAFESRAERTRFRQFLEQLRRNSIHAI